MNQSMMKKTILASAISTAITSTTAFAAAPAELPITNMVFSGTVYRADGYLNINGTVGPFDPATDLVTDPVNGGRMPAPGFDPLTASGNIWSVDNFNGYPWEAEQQTPYLDNADSWAFVYDHVNSDCTNPLNVTKNSGPCSDQGSYDYDLDQFCFFFHSCQEKVVRDEGRDGHKNSCCGADEGFRHSTGNGMRIA